MACCAQVQLLLWILFYLARPLAAKELLSLGTVSRALGRRAGGRGKKLVSKSEHGLGEWSR